MKQKGTGPGIGTWLLIFIVIALFMTGIAAGVIAKFGWPDGAGTFGDMFGVANALFSGMAFAGLILTLIQQQKEIREQSAMMEQQRFEASFFSLVDALQLEADSLSDDRAASDGPRTNKFVNGALAILNGDKTPAEKFRRLKEFCQFKGLEVRPYVMKFETVLRFIDSAQLNDKDLYNRVLDSQPSRLEFCVLAVWGHAEPDCFHIWKYVCRHSLKKMLADWQGFHLLFSENT